ncbi:unnamed protein product [Closterium sp. NIES-65]|nr:unnamed protein product [Closterium sp. NIES-65]
MSLHHLTTGAPVSLSHSSLHPRRTAHSSALALAINQGVFENSQNLPAPSTSTECPFPVPPPTLTKMAAGTPLCDADRLPWLLSLHALLCPLHALPLPPPSTHRGSQTHAPPQHTCQAPADSFALSPLSCSSPPRFPSPPPPHPSPPTRGPLVLACSALTPAYRNVLRWGDGCRLDADVRTAEAGDVGAGNVGAGREAQGCEACGERESVLMGAGRAEHAATAARASAAASAAVSSQCGQPSEGSNSSSSSGKGGVCGRGETGNASCNHIGRGSTGTCPTAPCAPVLPANRLAQPQHTSSTGTEHSAPCAPRLLFILLDVPPLVLADRLAQRHHTEGHFMPPCLLPSQLALLAVGEGEGDVVRVNSDGDLECVVDDAMSVVAQMNY